MTGNSSSTSQCLVLDALPQETQEHEGLLLVLSTALPWAISVVLHIGLFLILFFAIATMVRPPVGTMDLDAAVYFVPNSDKPGSTNPGAGDPNLPTAQDRYQVIDAKGYSQQDNPKGKSVYAGMSDNDSAHRFADTKGKGRILGLGGGSGGGGGGGPLAPFGPPGGGGPPGGKLNIFDPSTLRNVCYVIDRSGSMLETFDYVKAEMIRSINMLGPNKNFHVIFFASGAPIENPPKMLVPATVANKTQVHDFLMSKVVPEGQTNSNKAMERAFQVTTDKGEKVQLIYMLSDGEFSWECVNHIKKLNADGKVRINTIAFISDEGAPQLKKISDDSGGKFKFVTRDMLGN